MCTHVHICTHIHINTHWTNVHIQTHTTQSTTSTSTLHNFMDFLKQLHDLYSWKEWREASWQYDRTLNGLAKTLSDLLITCVCIWCCWCWWCVIRAERKTNKYSKKYIKEKARFFRVRIYEGRAISSILFQGSKFKFRRTNSCAIHMASFSHCTFSLGSR